MDFTESLTEETLILKLRSTEHDFVERKPRGKQGDWLQTAVAFANSAPIGWPAVLFVGVDNYGAPQQGTEKLEDLAKSVSDTIEKAYPPIYRHIVPIHFSDGGACLAVIIPGSELRPHFAGKSYVRNGPETKEASEREFLTLIEERQSKVREIRRWIGKEIVLSYPTSRASVLLHACNQFFLSVMNPSGDPNSKDSIPLRRVTISFDDQKGTLRLEVDRWVI